MRELSVALVAWVDLHTVLAVIVLLAVRSGWQWWHSPLCAMCYRGSAWRVRIVRRSGRVPEAMHVCVRCARDIDQRSIPWR